MSRTTQEQSKLDATHRYSETKDKNNLDQHMTVSSGTASVNMSDIIAVTPENANAILKGLPWLFRLVGRISASAIEYGSMTVRVPDGRALKFTGKQAGQDVDITLHNFDVLNKVRRNGTSGVGESYIDGDWTSTNITQFLEFFLTNHSLGNDVARSKSWVGKLILRIQHWRNSNTKSGSKKNISAHYDLGNAFYSQWLDPSMTYSSALYGDGANDLESAQRAKYRALIDATGIKQGDQVLEIGCGWGGFAEFAAREVGAKVTGLTISQEQFDFATQRIKNAALDDKVEIKFQDYRDETGQYDHVVSIEMFEAVGEKYWPIYFEMVRKCLKPGGTAGLQIITINDNDFAAYRLEPDFIQKHVFPGGMLPSPNILQDLTQKAGLDHLRERIFAQDYARTLVEWRLRFLDSWEQIKDLELGFDERFRRLWEFYLHYCEAGFNTSYIDVRQIIYQRPH